LTSLTAACIRKPTKSDDTVKKRSITNITTPHVVAIATVDGRNPAPPRMYKTIVNNWISYLSLNWLAGFLPSTVVHLKFQGPLKLNQHILKTNKTSLDW